MTDEVCESPVCDTFAAIGPRISGGLSATASLLIIFLIFRTRRKLSSIYHRIMFGMSVYDVLCSLAISLTTLPMPKDLPSGMTHGFEFAGRRFGTVQTCEAQGFFFVFGFVGMFSYNGMLCVYNTCSITLGMKELKIKRCVEPILHIIPFSIGLTIAVPPLQHGLYNPTNWDAWCTIALPEKNEDYNSPSGYDDLIRNYTNYDSLIAILISILFVVIFLCLGSIVYKIALVQRQLYKQNLRIRRRSQALEQVALSHKNTKVIAIQALAYIVAFLLSLSFLFVRAVTKETVLTIRLSWIFMSLQGVYNFLIFFSHKVYIYRRVHKDESIWSVTKNLFGADVEDPILFTRISLLRIDDDNGEMECRLNDEGDDDIVLKLLLDDDESLSEASIDIHIDDDSRKDSLNDFKGSKKGRNDEESHDVSRSGLSGFPSSSLTVDSKSNFPVLSIEDEDGLSISKGDNDGYFFSWMSRGASRGSK
jgi:hypothetical protein